MTKLADTKWDKNRLPSNKHPSAEDKKAMFDYYSAGQKRGESSEPLLQYLSERYEKSPRQILRIMSKVRKTNDQEQRALEERLEDRGKEAPCKQRVREVARELAERIVLPTFSDKRCWKDLPLPFAPGPVRLSVGEAVFAEKGTVKVTFPRPGLGADQLHWENALFSHLQTSGVEKYAGLVGNGGAIPMWARSVGGYLGRSLASLTLAARKSATHQMEIAWSDPDYTRDVKPVLTRWFPVTAWHDAVMTSGGHRWINDETWYVIVEIKAGIFELRCGAYTIASSESATDLGTFRSWHQKLRTDAELQKAALRLSQLQANAEKAGMQIRQDLEEFTYLKHVPGYCDMCPR